MVGPPDPIEKGYILEFYIPLGQLRNRENRSGGGELFVHPRLLGLDSNVVKKKGK